MIPIYILGLLQRFGSMHGYQIKKLIEEQLEDFTQIKLPTVYYHLEKMELAGLITAHREKSGARPEKTVYQVSDTGVDKFKKLLKLTLDFQYSPSFETDAAFYFSDNLKNSELSESLGLHIKNLRKELYSVELHRNETVKAIPEKYRASAEIIFEHHIMHYKAELAWAEKSIKTIKEAESNGKSKSNRNK